MGGKKGGGEGKRRKWPSLLPPIHSPPHTHISLFFVVRRPEQIFSERKGEKKRGGEKKIKRKKKRGAVKRAENLSLFRLTTPHIDLWVFREGGDGKA